MRYGSVCSGIEAATVAWHHMGWKPAFFSEIEKFPRAVLEHHYPEVPLHGDFTTIEQNQYGKIDLLVGGTPCQSFSIAGLRGGLDDDRGNLALEFCRLAQREQPRWIVWENVPGVLSSGGGRDFGSILGALEDLGYGLAYRVLDAQYFGVAQRRRRVFVVGYLGDWRPAAAVLFERNSMSGHPAPSREARKEAARAAAGGTYACGGTGEYRSSSPLLRTGADYGHGGEALVVGGGRVGSCVDVAPTLNAGGNKTGGDRPYGTSVDTCDSLIAFDTTQVTSPANYSSPQPGDPCHPLAAHAHAPAIAIQAGALRENPASGPDGVGVQEGLSYTLEARSEVQAVAYGLSTQQEPKWAEELSPTLARPSPTGGGQTTAVAFAQNQRDEVRTMEVAGALAAEPGTKQQTYLAQPFSIMPMNSGKDYKARPTDVAQPLMAGGPVGGNQGGDFIAETWAVRRLTPTECERLQGFPDNYTAIPWGKKTADECPDGPRYKVIGNSMAVPVMRWIGERIQLVDDFISLF